MSPIIEKRPAQRFERPVTAPRATTVPIVITCARGCEKALKFELRSVGIERSQAQLGAVACEAELDAIAQLNVFSRIGSRVLWVLAQFRAETPEELCGQLAAIRFEQYLPEGTTFAVEAHLRAVPWEHSLYAAQRVKDVVVDRMRARRKPRPEVDTRQPIVRFVLHWDAGQVTFALDTTGEPLHRRGYRPRDAGAAPMRENLAAAMLAIGHADVARPFFDPVCGSGTLGIEQGLRALNRYPAIKRRFAFERWRFTPPELRAALGAATQRARDEERSKAEAPIRISDIDPAQVDRARYGIERMGLSRVVEVSLSDATAATFSGERPVVVGNLPFGERLGRDDEKALERLYRELGARLTETPAFRALLLSSHPRAATLLQLGEGKTWPIWSGAIPATLYRWDHNATA